MVGAVASTAIVVGGDIFLTLFQVWMLAAKQQGLSAEEARSRFLANFSVFMIASAQPVDEVKP